MTRPERAIQVSRANGAPSRGPIAPGKLRSSRNAFTHGFSAQGFSVPTRHDPQFDQLSSAYHRDHVHRAWRAAGAIFDCVIGDLDDNLRALCLLARYQPACERSFSDSRRTLFTLPLGSSSKIDKTNLEIPPDQRGFVDVAIRSRLARARIGEDRLFRRTRKIDKTNPEVPQNQLTSDYVRSTRFRVRDRLTFSDYECPSVC